MFNDKDGKELLKLARAVIEAELKKEVYIVSDSVKSKYKQAQGLFVTMRKNGMDRGTFGYPETLFPLWKSVVQVAKAAAFNDNRFPPIGLSELKDVKIEITILSTLELVSEPISKYSEQIDLENHGLMLISAQSKSLLLPSLLRKYAHTHEEALDLLCQGAGLPKHAWSDSANKIYKFEVVIFIE